MKAFDLSRALEEILLAPAHSPPTLQVGMTVGARRWPYSGADSSTWQQPHRGVLLARNDPRAWLRSVLGEAPPQEAIDAHVSELDARGVLSNSLPVLWEFNPGLAMWEFAPSVVPYDQDLANWDCARVAAQGGAHAMRTM